LASTACGVVKISATADQNRYASEQVAI